MNKVSYSTGIAEETAPADLGLGIRHAFPIFSKPLGGGKGALNYLDTAASSQKPSIVIERLRHFLAHEHANIHRGAYALSADATVNYERAREIVAGFIGAPSSRNIIFTRGTTEAINLVSHAMQHLFGKGDSILLTMLEHHSNIVPWQLLAERAGSKVLFANISPQAVLDKEDFLSKLTREKPKLVAFTHVANSFGSVLPVAELTEAVKSQGAFVLIDVAQSVPHEKIDVVKLGCDFAAFSGHKLYGPTGIGVLYASERALDSMQPFQGGGGMIQAVSTVGSTWAEVPQKFEAGTPAIAEAIALGAAIEFVKERGLERIANYEMTLFNQAWDLLSREPGVKLFGPRTVGQPQHTVIAFNVDNIHPHDLSTVADSFGVQIRAGHHCAMPALKQVGVHSTARASIGMYSAYQDFETLCLAIRQARKMFS